MPNVSVLTIVAGLIVGIHVLGWLSVACAKHSEVEPITAYCAASGPYVGECLDATLENPDVNLTAIIQGGTPDKHAVLSVVVEGEGIGPAASACRACVRAARFRGDSNVDVVPCLKAANVLGLKNTDVHCRVVDGPSLMGALCSTTSFISSIGRSFATANAEMYADVTRSAYNTVAKHPLTGTYSRQPSNTPEDRAARIARNWYPSEDRD